MIYRNKIRIAGAQFPGMARGKGVPPQCSTFKIFVIITKLKFRISLND